jgi:hypothetical protein
MSQARAGIKVGVSRSSELPSINNEFYGFSGAMRLEI